MNGVTFPPSVIDRVTARRNSVMDTDILVRRLSANTRLAAA
jgi:hypothetical protein